MGRLRTLDDHTLMMVPILKRRAVTSREYKQRSIRW